MSETQSPAFLDAKRVLETYEPRGHLCAERTIGGYWIFDRWRDSWLKEWKIHKLAENLTKNDVTALGVSIAAGHE